MLTVLNVRKDGTVALNFLAVKSKTIFESILGNRTFFYRQLYCHTV